MEDAELAPAEFADSGSTASAVSFSSHTLELINAIVQLDVKWQSLGINQYNLKWQDLVNMLKGAWAVLESKDNPDMQAHAAHSMRELIEKAPYYIDAVPIQSKDPNKRPTNGETRKEHIRILVTTYAGKDGQISEQRPNWKYMVIEKLHARCSSSW